MVLQALKNMETGIKQEWGLLPEKIKRVNQYIIGGFLMPDILFTCAGTTDPVRGGHDGGILHVVRHYRPEKVYLFLSKEMVGYETKDHRFERTFRHASEKWCYPLEWHEEQTDLEDVADLDAVSGPLYGFFRRVAEENPGYRILINLSSGTPQMKIILAQLAVSLQAPVLGVQVLNPQKQSGDSKRTNDPDYDVEFELELNEDDEPGAPNRCLEPKLLAVQRDRQCAQIRSLLARRDYGALAAMDKELPPQLAKLACHLAARSELQMKEAAKLARGMTLPFKLYPALDATDERYRLLSEYYLLLRNLQRTQRYTEFVLRLNPFLTQLLLRLIEQNLPCPLGSILETRGKHTYLSPEGMERHAPEIKQAFEREMANRRKNLRIDWTKDFSLYLGIPMMHALGGLTPALLDVLDACEKLNGSQRNAAAHQLYAVTEKQICEECCDSHGQHYGSFRLVQLLGQMLKRAYPDVCDDALFTVYDRCEAYLLERL